MNFKILSLFFFSSISVFSFPGCGDRPLFDELATNRIKVVIKGTYESNDPAPWDTSAFPISDSVYICREPSGDINPGLFMFDIAGFKVASGKHSQYFANYRKIFSSAISDREPFFNGTGVICKNDDTRPNFVWQSVDLYIRKMLFDSAKQYVPDGVNGWTYEEDVQALFHEKTVNGYNFNLAQVLTYYDYLKENYLSINRIFPLVIPVEDGFVFDYDEEEIVLEVRLVVKNFIKKYEYEYADSDGNLKLRHFYALSDWLRNIKRNEPAPSSDTSGRMGGNLLAVARYYVPGKTAGITGDTGTGDCYVVAIKTNHDISEYNFTVPARPACDTPKPPRPPVLPSSPTPADETDYIEALLDYYLQYEAYKSKHDAFADCVNDGSYETEWDDYETAVESFKMPPLATWAPGGAYTLTNVPAGEYTLWYGTVSSAASLPSSFTQIGTSSITISEADFGNEVPGP